MKDKPVLVYTPNGVPWSARFTSLDAAWRRLLSLKGLRNTPQDRAALVTEGWKVVLRESKPW